MFNTETQATLDEVRNLVQQKFPDAVIDIDEDTEYHRMTGTITSDEFAGKDPEERNRLVSERVRRELGYRGLNLGFLFPVAPGDAP
jgi:stress-induced morphogen